MGAEAHVSNASRRERLGRAGTPLRVPAWPRHISSDDDRPVATAILAGIPRIRGAALGLTLALASLLPVPATAAAASADTDGDGLPDTWEINYGLDPNDNGSVNPNNGAAGDPDNDGLPNDEEYFLGSSPLVNESGKTWKARPSKADLLVVSAHPDDEGIFFGGALPYYAQVQQREVVFISMTSGDASLPPTVRETELRNALSAYGQRNQPMLARFRDSNTATLNDTWDIWADGVIDGDDVTEGRQKAVDYVATRIRRFRPDVVITHGLGGEYGHQNHIATSLAVVDAVALAADPAVNLGGLPAWRVKKTYLHEFGSGRLFHDFWEAPFTELGGKTPRATTNAGLAFHVTQGPPKVSTAYLTGEVEDVWEPHPSEWWGLYSTTVGPDTIAPDFTIAGTTYSGWARGDFFEHIIDETKTPATIVLGSLTQTFSGFPRPITATTTPVGLAVKFTYNGSPIPPTSAGSYTVIGTINDATYAGVASGTFVISKASATLTLSNLARTYNGNPKSPTPTTSPGGLPVTFTYNGSATTPSNVGTYAVVGTINHPNYTGSASATLVISKASATVNLGNLARIYTGNPKPATATTSPGGLAVSFTYNGSADAPIDAGSYAVVGTINDVNYDGSASGTLVIGKAVATVTLDDLLRFYSGDPRPAIARTSPSGLRVTFTYDGSAEAPTNAGSYKVIGTIDDANYDGTASGTLVITKATATVTLSSTTQTYDGTAKPVTVITTPGGLNAITTYAGSSVAPTAVGAYAVAAVVDDANYMGSAGGTLQIVTAVLSHQPESIQVIPGGPTTLSVTATGGSNPTYQWQFEGTSAGPSSMGSRVPAWVDIAGATNASYTIPSTQRFNSGRYRVVVTANGVSTVSDPVNVTLDALPHNNTRLLNLSTRGLAQNGSSVLIPGFVVQGLANKKLLIRTIGPTLNAPPILFGGGTIPDPMMELKRYNVATGAYENYAANDNWQSNTNAADIITTSAALGAFELKDPRDAALLVDLPSGQYSVIAGDKNGASGIAIVELYDADSDASGSRLINISNRGFAGIGQEVIIPGFVVSSEGPKTLLVRVVGPALSDQYGVPGTMADPKLAIYRHNTATNNDDLLFTQDNWSDNPDAAYTTQIAQQVSAFPLDVGSKDAAFVVTLEPGVYTVVGSSADGVSTGVVLVELYAVP